MVKRTITITTFFLILTMIMGLIIVLNKSSFAADDDIASGTSGTCSWRVSADGVLIISPTDGISGTLAPNEIDFNTGYPWTSASTGSFRLQIVEVRFEGNVKTPTICRGLFGFLSNCRTIDLTNLDTSESTDLQSMFYNCRSLNTIVGLSNLNVSNATNLSLMFYWCKSLSELDLSSWDMSRVTKFNSATVRQSSAYQYVQGIFESCSNLTTIKFPTSLNIARIDSLERMFFDCRNLESLDLSIFDTRNFTEMKSMFYGCDKLSSVVLGENFDFKGQNILDENQQAVFPTITPNANSLYTGVWIREDGAYGPYTSKELRDNYTSEMAGRWIWEVKPCAVFTGEGNLSFIRPRNAFDKSNAITQTITSVSGLELTGRVFLVNETSESDNNRTWASINTQVKNVVFVDEIKPKNTSYWFHAFYNCTEMNLSKLDVSDVSNMNFMFNDCGSLRAIDVSNFNTSNVTTMDHLFNGCANLTTIDVSNFDVSNVTNLACLFNDCGKIKSINVSGWDVTSATNINHMFNCASLETLDISSFNTSNATYMAWMLAGANSLKTIVLGENFVFEGRNISNVSNRAIFPTPPTSLPNTGKWIRSDYAFGPYTPEELRDNYTSSMAGTWKWESVYSVSYSYNSVTGASELPEERFYREGEEVTVAPDATATGYTFSGWSRTGTFNMPAEDVEITGSFTERTDIPYKVEHYLEDLNSDTYSLAKTDNLIGTIYTEVVANAKDYEGFTFDDSIDGTKTSGNIEGDGSLVLKLYYKRNSYNVTYAYTGDIPNDASPLPQMENYKYGAEINVPENATAEGYTFSGWIKDYITMPAQDIEITGYFIENPKSYNYKVEYYFDGELDSSLEEILNAEKDEEISITPQTPLKHGERNYTLISNNHKITISINEEENVINVYYETDVLDYEIDNSEDTIEGDGIPDKYQLAIYYKVDNGSWDDGTKGTKTDVITLKDKNGNYAEDGTGELNVPQVGNKPAEGYTNGSWNKKIPKSVSSKDNGKEFIYSYKIISKANISRAEGKLSNPKTDDIMHNYLLIGIGGLLVLMIVRKIRRKYSRKAKKIQY